MGYGKAIEKVFWIQEKRHLNWRQQGKGVDEREVADDLDSRVERFEGWPSSHTLTLHACGSQADGIEGFTIHDRIYIHDSIPNIQFGAGKKITLNPRGGFECCREDCFEKNGIFGIVFKRQVPPRNWRENSWSHWMKNLKMLKATSPKLWDRNSAWEPLHPTKRLRTSSLWFRWSTTRTPLTSRNCSKTRPTRKIQSPRWTASKLFTGCSSVLLCF